MWPPMLYDTIHVLPVNLDHPSTRICPVDHLAPVLLLFQYSNGLKTRLETDDTYFKLYDLNDPCITGEEEDVECCATITCVATTGGLVPSNLRLPIQIKGKIIHSLVDLGSTHNFIQSRIVTEHNLQTITRGNLSVETIGGGKRMMTIVCSNIHFSMGELDVHDVFFVIEMYLYDMILGPIEEIMCV